MKALLGRVRVADNLQPEPIVIIAITEDEDHGDWFVCVREDGRIEHYQSGDILITGAAPEDWRVP